MNSIERNRSRRPSNATDDPASLGLIEHRDDAQTWSTVSVNGETDFHNRVAVGDTGTSASRIYGYDAGRQTLVISTDSGRTWKDGATLSIGSLAVNRAVPATVYATTEAGLQVSEDSGSTFSTVSGAPRLFLIDSADTGAGSFVVVDVDGAISATDDSGATWVQRGRFASPPDAVSTVAGEFTTWLLGADERGIVATPDFGGSWIVLVPGGS